MATHSRRRRYRRYHSLKMTSKGLKSQRMKFGKASKYCSRKNGYTTKTARSSCMSRRMRGQFAGR